MVSSAWQTCKVTSSPTLAREEVVTWKLENTLLHSSPLAPCSSLRKGSRSSVCYWSTPLTAVVIAETGAAIRAEWTLTCYSEVVVTARGCTSPTHEWAEVVQRPQGHEQDAPHLISTLQIMPGWRQPRFPHPTPWHTSVPPHFSWPAQNWFILWTAEGWLKTLRAGLRNSETHMASGQEDPTNTRRPCHTVHLTEPEKSWAVSISCCSMLDKS